MSAYHREENSGHYNKIIGTRSDGRFVVEHSSQNRDSVRTLRRENEHVFYVRSSNGMVMVSREEALREFRNCASAAPTTEPQQDGAFIITRPDGGPSTVTHSSYADAEQEARRLASANTGKRFYVARLLSVAEVPCPVVQVTPL